MTTTRGVAAALAAVVVVGLSGPTASAGDRSPATETVRATKADSATRVSDTVLRKERYDYRPQGWRVREADGLPGWLKLRDGRLTGTPRRLGRWRVTLDERGVGKQRGERRRTVLVVRAVKPRAAAGTVLVTRGIDGRPANADSRDVTVSGDGSTVVFSSRATNLVAGTEQSAGRLFVWDVTTRQVSLLHPEQWAVLKGVSRDGRRVLVRLTAGLFLIDRTTGSVTQVAPRVVDAALTADGERVLYQDRGDELGSPAPQLLEWTRATGATRTVVPSVSGRTFAGLSGDGRFALFTGSASSAMLDTTTGTFRDIGRTGLEGGNASWVDVSDNGSLLSVRGSGLPSGGGTGGDPVSVVRGTLLSGTTYGPASGNLGASITADGSHFTVATATRHLRVVVTDTSERTSPFVSRPSGSETWASLSDDASRLAYVSTGHDLLRGTGRGVANVFMWVRTR